MSYLGGNCLTDKEKRVREKFRESAISHGVGGDCVIDKDTFAEISGVAGCFKSEDGRWIVYDTDERAQICGVASYASALTAYEDLASRLGFCLNWEGRKKEYGQTPSIFVVNELYR